MTPWTLESNLPSRIEEVSSASVCPESNFGVFDRFHSLALTLTFMTTMSPNVTHDDSFELYDLRVEVVCPPGERILCGAKEGDHFTLQGEMLYPPPGQGFSIYSLCEY